MLKYSTNRSSQRARLNFVWCYGITDRFKHQDCIFLLRVGWLFIIIRFYVLCGYILSYLYCIRYGYWGISIRLPAYTDTRPFSIFFIFFLRHFAIAKCDFRSRVGLGPWTWHGQEVAKVDLFCDAAYCDELGINKARVEESLLAASPSGISPLHSQQYL